MLLSFDFIVLVTNMKKTLILKICGDVLYHVKIKYTFQLIYMMSYFYLYLVLKKNIFYHFIIYFKKNGFKINKKQI